MPAYAPAMFMYWARGFAGQSAMQSTAFAVIVRTVTSARRSLTRFTSNEPRGVLTKKFENPVGAVSGSIGGGVGFAAGEARVQACEGHAAEDRLEHERGVHDDAGVGVLLPADALDLRVEVGADEDRVQRRRVREALEHGELALVRRRDDHHRDRA